MYQNLERYIALIWQFSTQAYQCHVCYFIQQFATSQIQLLRGSNILKDVRKPNRNTSIFYRNKISFRNITEKDERPSDDQTVEYLYNHVLIRQNLTRSHQLLMLVRSLHTVLQRHYNASKRFWFYCLILNSHVIHNYVTFYFLSAHPLSNRSYICTQHTLYSQYSLAY